MMKLEKASSPSNAFVPKFGRGKVYLLTNFEDGFLPSLPLKEHSETISSKTAMPMGKETSLSVLEKTKNAFEELKRFLLDNRNRLRLGVITAETLQGARNLWETFQKAGFKPPIPHILIVNKEGKEYPAIETKMRSAFPFTEERHYKINYRTLDPQAKDTQRGRYSRDKDYEVWQAVGQASALGDLVIAAGDKASDFDMLNPANFVPFKDDSLKSFNDITDMARNPKAFAELLENDRDKDLQADFNDLPFVGLVLRDGDKPLPEPLQKLVDAYGHRPNPKVIVGDKRDLVNSVKDAIRSRLPANALFRKAFFDNYESSVEKYILKKAKGFQDVR